MFSSSPSSPPASVSPAADSIAVARACVGVNVASNSVKRRAICTASSSRSGRVGVDAPQFVERAGVEVVGLRGLPPRLLEVAAGQQALLRARAERFRALLRGRQAPVKLERFELAERLGDVRAVRGVAVVAAHDPLELAHAALPARL